MSVAEPGDGLTLKQQGLDVTWLDALASMVDLCLQQGLPAGLADFTELPFEQS